MKPRLAALPDAAGLGLINTWPGLVLLYLTRVILSPVAALVLAFQRRIVQGLTAGR